MIRLRLNLEPGPLARLAALIGLLNLVFIAGMTAFLYYWPHRLDYGRYGRAFIGYVLLQFHLGAENVVAAWYSSMLLLAVAIASAAAFALDGRAAPDAGARRGDRLRWGWILFAAAFALLSLDEIGSLHERVGMLVSLNRASIAPGATLAVGWVYILAIPIAAVAAGMLAFGWIRLRRAPLAFALLATGVLLYVSDPFLELLEGWLVAHGSGRVVLERIMEEGVAELGGTTCFLFGVLLYCRRVTGGGVQTFEMPPPVVLRAGAVVLICGAAIAHAIVRRLPAADTGIAENWFPAAALFLLSVGYTSRLVHEWAARAAVALALSAYFGAGLFGYTSWYRTIGYRGVLVDTVVTAIALTLIALSTRYPTPSARHAAPSTAR